MMNRLPVRSRRRTYAVGLTRAKNLSELWSRRYLDFDVLLGSMWGPEPTVSSSHVTQ
jgi:hypothetical protein